MPRVLVLGRLNFFSQNLLYFGVGDDRLAWLVQLIGHQYFGRFLFLLDLRAVMNDLLHFRIALANHCL